MDEPHVKVTLGDIYREVLETKGIVTGQASTIQEHGRRIEKLENDTLSRRGLLLGLSIAAVVIPGLSFLVSRVG